MTIEEEVNDFLEHHGIKGMKWGIRNKKDRKNKAGLSTGSKVAIGAAGAASVAAASAFIATRGKVPVSQLRSKEAELVRIKHLIGRAAWQNPVHKNAANEVRRFVALL